MAEAPRMPAPLDGGQIKKSRASLVGGVAVAAGVAILWIAIARDLGAVHAGSVSLGLLVAGLVGLWIWRADL